MNITKIGLLVLIVISLLSIDPACAQDALTWEDCVREAKENNPDLFSAAEEIKQAKRDLEIDLSAILPQITTNASGSRGKSASAKTDYSYSYGLTGEQLIFDGFKTSSEVSNAFKTVKAQEYNYAVVSSNIRLDMRSAFIELLKAQDLVPIVMDIADRRKQNLELVKLRYQAGREHRGSLLTAEADLAQSEFEVSQARRDIPLAQRRLAKELGRDRKEGIRAQGDFSLQGRYRSVSDFEYLADATPFLRELIAKKEAARHSLHSEGSDFFPQVYLNTSVGNTGTNFVPRNERWSAGMSISLPLFEGGSRIAEVAKAKSQFNQAKEDERSGRYSVLVTLEETWKDLKDSMEDLSVKKKSLEATEERAKITKAQYEKGIVSFDDWVIIENSLALSRKNYLNAQADMLIKEAYWIQAIGGTLEYDEK